jgi:hypothetical protein
LSNEKGRRGFGMKKKILSLLLALVMVLGMMPFAAAAEVEKDAAEILYDLGLFKGTGTNADGTYETIGPMKADSGCFYAQFVAPDKK